MEGTSMSTQAPTITHGPRRIINPVNLIVAGIGAILMLIAAFLPLWEDNAAFSTIAKNTLIQSGDGIFLVITAVLVAVALYRIYDQQRHSWWRAIVKSCG